MSPDDVRLCRQMADFYRLRGLQPLPSRLDAKRPFCRYAEWWTGGAPADLFDRFPTTNVQVMCGRHWRLLAIDLDGPEAIERWDWRRTPRTWVTHSGGKGRHLWFRLPEAYPTPLPKAVLWKGDGEHSAIERLCDRSLIMAPPSIHPTTGRRYQFQAGHSPKQVPMPAACPGWVLAMKPIEPERPDWVAPIVQPRRVVVGDSLPPWREVIDAIPDKLALVRSWGLRVEGRPSPKGWASCHAIGREDRKASAAVHVETGRYVDLGSGLRLSLFDLAVHVGVYGDFREAVTDLGERFHVQAPKAPHPGRPAVGRLGA